MKDLALMIGSIMPEEYLLGELKKSLEAHMVSSSEETKRKLELHCILFLSKCASEQDPDGLMRDIKKQ